MLSLGKNRRTRSQTAPRGRDSPDQVFTIRLVERPRSSGYKELGLKSKAENWLSELGPEVRGRSQGLDAQTQGTRLPHL